MNEEYTQEEGMSLKDIFNMLKAHWIAIVLVTIIGALAGLGLKVVTPPQYQASLKVYIQERKASSDGTNKDDTISTDIVNGLRLINTFIAYVTDSPVAKETENKIKAIKQEGKISIKTENLNYATIMKGLTASTINDNTLCVTVSYTHTDPMTAKVVLENTILAACDVSTTADAFNMFKDRISTAYSQSKLGVGECADVKNVSKGMVFYVGLGLIGGLVIGIAYAIIKELMDNTIKDKNYLENKYNVKVIGSIPEFVEENKNADNK